MQYPFTLSNIDINLNACYIDISVDHQFDYLDIVKRSKYNLEPVGHPWAALVLFDAVMVRVRIGGCYQGNSYCREIFMVYVIIVGIIIVQSLGGTYGF